MPLSEQSSLEDSLARILGAPATPAATPAAAPQASLYSSPMSRPGSTSIALGAEQPVTAEPPPVAAAPPAPIVTTTPRAEAPATTAPVTGEVAEAAPVQPGLTKGYSDYYAGNEAALDMSMYRGDATNAGVNQTWPGGTNPYEYRNEYNQYVLDNDKALADYYKSQGVTDLTYNEYWGGNQEALDYSHYRGSGTDMGVGSNWGESGNPYQYRNEYNAYIAGAPAAEGAVAATPMKAPVNPGPQAPWQESQQYWKDLEAYNATGGK